MIHLRVLSLLAVTTLVACRDAKVSVSLAELVVQPQAIDFGAAFVGHRDTTTIELRNTGRHALLVTLDLATPFDAPESVTVNAGESVQVELGLRALAAGPLFGALIARVGEGAQEFSVRANAVAVPGCPARDCVNVVFNPATGACDETTATDGTNCGATNQCVLGGLCRAGECVGEARNCDDGNLCTTDACSPESGCLHETVTCPGSLRACEVPVCEPATGCSTVPASDGASCGSNDCTTAQVCINAQCVARTAPEGSQCAPASVCQGPGVCRQGDCERPAPGTLQPRWRYTPLANHTLAFLGHVDDDGNLYATETANDSSNGDRVGISESGAPPSPGRPTYLLSLSPTGHVRFRVQVTDDCASCSSGLSYVLDSKSGVLFFNAKGRTHAHSMFDGRPLWAVVPSAGVPVVDALADGGGSFSLSAPLPFGADVVAVPVMEGANTHKVHVRLFDLRTGALRANVQREGHLYDPMVSGNGELWISSGACWAPAADVERIDSLGLRLRSRPGEWVNLITGTDDAYGLSGGHLFHLEPGMHVSDLTTLAGPISGGLQLLTSGSQLVVWDYSSGVLRSIDRSNSTRTWEKGNLGIAWPDFELLDTGGVAWTSPQADANVLVAVDGTGEEILSCRTEPFTSPTTIINGRAVGFAADAIVSYDVPGLDVAKTGWVAKNGSLQRARSAR